MILISLWRRTTSWNLPIYCKSLWTFIPFLCATDTNCRVYLLSWPRAQQLYVTESLHPLTTVVGRGTVNGTHSSYTFTTSDPGQMSHEQRPRPIFPTFKKKKSTWMQSNKDVNSRGSVQLWTFFTMKNAVRKCNLQTKYWSLVWCTPSFG